LSLSLSPSFTLRGHNAAINHGAKSATRKYAPAIATALGKEQDMNELNKNKFLSKSEYNRLIVNLDKHELYDFRNVTMLMTSLFTGARPSEVLAITKQDLSKENKTVFLKGLKGSRDRELPLPPGIFSRLMTLAIEAPKDQERLFPIALRTMQGIWHQYRPAKKGIKSLRHTFAIRLYEKTKDIRLTQMALGHRYMNTTQIYAEYVYNQEELRRLIL
jgi:integrase